MANIFFISDPHYGHEKCYTTFKRADGVTPLRPFASAEEGDEEMVKRWNEVVKEHDKVYCLGDIVIGKKHLPILSRLNGSKRLVRGNHDIFKTSEYAQYFKEIYGVRVLDDMVLSHVPLHPASITPRWNVNVHGHLHANIVEKWVDDPSMGSTWHMDQKQIPDPLYFSVCVEQIDYRPIEYSELMKRVKERRDEYGTPDFGEYTHKKASAS